MGTLKPGPCSIMSWAEHTTWKSCMCKQLFLKGFWFLDIIPGQLCGVPQASLTCVSTGESSASSVCTKLALIQGVFLLRLSCHLCSGDNSSYYPCRGCYYTWLNAVLKAQSGAGLPMLWGRFFLPGPEVPAEHDLSPSICCLLHGI